MTPADYAPILLASQLVSSDLRLEFSYCLDRHKKLQLDSLSRNLLFLWVCLTWCCAKHVWLCGWAPIVEFFYDCCLGRHWSLSTIKRAEWTYITMSGWYTYLSKTQVREKASSQSWQLMSTSLERNHCVALQPRTPILINGWENKVCSWIPLLWHTAVNPHKLLIPLCVTIISIILMKPHAVICIINPHVTSRGRNPCPPLILLLAYVKLQDTA